MIENKEYLEVWRIRGFEQDKFAGKVTYKPYEGIKLYIFGNVNTLKPNI